MREVANSEQCNAWHMASPQSMVAVTALISRRMRPEEGVKRHLHSLFVRRPEVESNFYDLSKCIQSMRKTALFNTLESFRNTSNISF